MKKILFTLLLMASTVSAGSRITMSGANSGGASGTPSNPSTGTWSFPFGISASSALIGDTNSNMSLFVGTLPVNSGFGPQVVQDGIWNKTNASGGTYGSFHFVETTLDPYYFHSGIPYIPGPGADLNFNPIGVIFSTYDVTNPAGEIQWYYDSSGFNINNQLTTKRASIRFISNGDTNNLSGDYNKLNLAINGAVLIQAGNLDPGTGGSESSTILAMSDAFALNPVSTIEGGLTFGASFNLDDSEGQFDFVTSQNGDPRFDIWGFRNGVINFINCDAGQCGQDQGSQAANDAYQKTYDPARINVDGDLYANKVAANRYGRKLILTGESDNNGGAGGDIAAIPGLGDSGQLDGGFLVGTTTNDASGSVLQVKGAAHFYGGQVWFGDGTTLGVGAGYMQATSASGNAGYIANRDTPASGFASFDLLDNSNISTGWSIQMQPGDENLHFMDRANDVNRMLFTTDGVVVTGTFQATGNATFDAASYFGDVMTITNGDFFITNGDIHVGHGLRDAGDNLGAIRDVMTGTGGGTFWDSLANVISSSTLKNVSATTTTVTLGGSTLTARMGGTIFDFQRSTSNLTTVETDLYVSSVPAYVLNVNGDKIIGQMAGSYIGSTSSKDLKLYLGTTTIFDTGAIAVSLSSSFDLQFYFHRGTSSQIRCSVKLNTSGASTTAYTNYTTVGGITNNVGMIVRLTGTASAVGAASGDVTANMAYAELKPAKALP